jgi:uncharacterized SAM-binding protein YcdF (DUF218 family)
MTLTPLLDLINGIPRDLILPPANLFLLIVIGLAIWRRWPRAGRIVAGTGFAALAFLSTTGGARLFVAPLEAGTTPLRAPERAGAQAIVVLAAGRLQRAPEYGGRDIPDYVALARVRYAAHLQRITKLPVLVSGGGSSSNSNSSSNSGADHGEPDYSYAQAMADALREDFGVPVRWIEGRSNNTAENANYSAALLRKDGVKRILLVTDAMHMVRARAVFQRAGLEVVDAPTIFFSNQKVPLQAWVPSPEGMRRSWYAIYELIGNAWYKLRAAAA